MIASLRRSYTYGWVISHIWMRHITHMDESYHTYGWVISHIWMSHITHMDESCDVYEGTSHVISYMMMHSRFGANICVTWLIHSYVSQDASKCDMTHVVDICVCACIIEALRCMISRKHKKWGNNSQKWARYSMYCIHCIHSIYYMQFTIRLTFENLYLPSLRQQRARRKRPEFLKSRFHNLWYIVRWVWYIVKQVWNVVKWVRYVVKWVWYVVKWVYYEVKWVPCWVLRSSQMSAL